MPLLDICMTEKILDGKLFLFQDGVKVWLTLPLINKHISRLTKDLQIWKKRKQILEESIYEKEIHQEIRD